MTSQVDSSYNVDDAKLSVEGMRLLLNNEWKEAEDLFSQHRDDSALLCFGYCLCKFLQSIMTYEDDALEATRKMLQSLEKRCESSANFHKSTHCKKHRKVNPSAYLEDKLQRQIITADSIMYQAVLTLIHQDLTGYVKGGWLLRKAWKLYEKLHKEISALKKSSETKTDLAAEVREVIDPSDSDTTDDNDGRAVLKASSSTSLMSTESTEAVDDLRHINDKAIDRLLGAVCFGYGSFQLCLSLIPPGILKLIEFLGFEGDRALGLEALNICSHSHDMKAPIATLTLVWYHTVVRAFFALDGSNMTAGVSEGRVILERARNDFPQSSLFLFFTGRIHRLQCEVDEAFEAYRVALEASANQRETRLICQHEIGWLCLMTLDWEQALENFQLLKEESRWSKSFYSYLSACCQGALGDVTQAVQTLKQVPSFVKNKNHQIEQFVLRRVEKMKKLCPSQEIFTLLLLEVLYLWNSVPMCKKDDLNKMLDECNKQTDKNVFHLRSLIEGAIYSQLDMEEMSIQCFEEAVARHLGMKGDQHVPAFACYEMGSSFLASATSFQEQEKGRKLLIKAKDNYKNFDFDNRLHVRINAALKRLKNEGTPI